MTEVMTASEWRISPAFLHRVVGEIRRRNRAINDLALFIDPGVFGEIQLDWRENCGSAYFLPNDERFGKFCGIRVFKRDYQLESSNAERAIHHIRRHDGSLAAIIVTPLPETEPKIEPKSPDVFGSIARDLMKSSAAAELERIKQKAIDDLSKYCGMNTFDPFKDACRIDPHGPSNLVFRRYLPQLYAATRNIAKAREDSRGLSDKTAKDWHRNA